MAARSPLTPEEFVKFRPLVLRAVREASEIMSVEESTAMVLLVLYKWDVATLVADHHSLLKLHPLLDCCPRRRIEETLAAEGTPCVSCQNANHVCYILHCGHAICPHCLAATVSTELELRPYISCPAPTCPCYIKHSMLTGNEKYLYEQFLCKSYIDNNEKSCFTKCIDVVWSYKFDVLRCLYFAILGFGMYKAHLWGNENPCKAFFLRKGFSKFLF